MRVWTANNLLTAGDFNVWFANAATQSTLSAFVLATAAIVHPRETVGDINPLAAVLLHGGILGDIDPTQATIKSNAASIGTIDPTKAVVIE